jgi:predicted SprT family Zn-dependent metalloprotease
MRKSSHEEYLPGPERGKASFLPPNSNDSPQLTINFTMPEKPRDQRMGAVIQRRPPDDVITRKSCGGAYQQFFDFFLKEESPELPVSTRLKHDIALRQKVEERRPRCREEYDLREVLDNIGNFYGVETSHLAIGWFHSRGGKATIELGYVLLDEDIILINEVLNMLPRYVIEAIIAHELCHLIIPPRPKNGRLIKHHTEFKQYYMLHPSSRLYERNKAKIHAFLFN